VTPDITWFGLCNAYFHGTLSQKQREAEYTITECFTMTEFTKTQNNKVKQEIKKDPNPWDNKRTLPQG
jgi:hypothetical protein